MLSRALLASVVLAGVASANNLVTGPAAMRHAFEALQAGGIEPRATEDPAVAKCTAALDSVLADAPTLPFHMTDYFACTGLPASFTSAYSSFISAGSSWLAVPGNSDAYSSAMWRVRFPVLVRVCHLIIGEGIRWL